MQLLKMRGYAITDAIRFITWFSPGDLLRSRELAAGFLKQHFGNISLLYRFHADIFWGCVFAKRKQDFRLKDPFGYNTHIYGYINLEYRQKQLVGELLDEEDHSRRLAQLWDLSLKAGLEKADRCILFCLLTAGYALAGKTLEDCPLSPEEARQAYLRQEPRQQTEETWLVFPDSGEIRLEARNKPYRVLLKEGAQERLRAGLPIRPRKLIATAHAQGNNDVPVTLELYTSREDQAPRRVVFYSGDYRYANFVGNVPVYFHNVTQETAACRMERRGNSLVCLDKIRGKLLLHVEKLPLDILGFALEENSPGWLLLTEKGLDDSRYSLRQNVPVQTKDIVQMQFRDMEVLVLDNRGTVYSGIHSVGSGVISLEDF